ncbi:exodeoxyribonuclease V, alpha subunit [Verrucomicrobiia bacterium DG1235]|nr:exodeoxyribonuclease V, alpha subunit [Verrucomicrobiae bacterium DG1235]
MIGKEYEELSLLKEPPFTAADRMLVAHLRDDWGESNSWILLAAALANLSAREGHAFFDLGLPRGAGVSLPRSWPDLSHWEKILANSPVARSETDAGCKPLVLCSGTALYLEKYYAFEQSLAKLIAQRCEPDSTEEIAEPAERAAKRKFFVITGGPGTGKTTLALRYLNTLLDKWELSRPPRFAAIAPTGKAAARLAESIASGVARLELASDREEALLGIPCLTIHRLLGALPHRTSFRKNSRHPLRFDTLVIDESSMIDLPLMLRLFEALPSDCQVLLLGDKDQLSSVDVGSVLADMLAASELEGSPLSSSVLRLTKTYRFSEDSGIYQACQLARDGDSEGFSEMLDSGREDFEFHALRDDAKRIPKAALSRSFLRYKGIANSTTPEEGLLALNEGITLTPTRRGAFGSLEFNRLVERMIRQEQNLDPLSTQSIHGAPIIVLENDYELELYNGDLGLVWIDEISGIAFAFFGGADGVTRKFRLSELPRHESAFALTIHKSQGSEFLETVCLFAPEADRNLTRELVYTAFSRAKERLVVFAEKTTLSSAIGRQAFRATRLAELLA